MGLWKRRRPLGLLTVGVALAIAAAACGSSSGGSSGTTASGGSAAPSASAPPPSPAPTGTPVVIGSVGQYSGFAGATSKSTADAVDAWVKLTNDRGGINGHPVKYVVKDDGNDATKALSAVKSLVEQDHVVALVGIHESGLESTWASYAAAKKIPVIGGSSFGAIFLTNPDFFATSQTSINYVALQVNAAKLTNKKKVSAIVCAELPACQQLFPLLQSSAKALGIAFSPGLAVSASAPSYTSQCLKLRSAGVDAVILNTSQDVSNRFIADCGKQGYRPQLVDPGQSFSTDVSNNSAYEGAYVVNDSFNWVGTSPTTKEFLDAMSRYSPKSPLNSSATGGWAAAVTFGKVLAGISGTPTPANIISGLYALPANSTANGVLPGITFSSGKTPTIAPCGWYVQIKDKKLTTPQGEAAVCIK